VTAPEPLKLTLAELIQHLGEYEYWLGYDLSGMYAGMYVVMPMDEDSPVRCGTGSTPWEAANDAMPKRQVAPRDEAAELRAALEALAGSYVTNKVSDDDLWHMLVRTEVLERAYAALAASEGQQ